MQNNKEIETKKAVTKLIKLAKKIYPNLEYEAKIPEYEDVDAGITIYCPLKYEQKIYRALYDIKYKLLNEKDILIVTAIYPSKHKLKKKAS